MVEMLICNNFALPGGWAQCGLRAGCGFPAVAGLLGWLLGCLLGEYESSEPWPWPRIKQC